MPIYVDPEIDFGWKLGASSHMISDTSEQELDEFALSIGLKVKWKQLSPVVHYDLTSKKRIIAIKNGAIPLDRRTFIDLLRHIKEMYSC